MHAWLVLDAVRTRAFFESIQRVVRPGDTVVDIGSGSGLLALFAAKAGAKKVYAIERSPSANLAIAHAVANGVADVIEVVREEAADAFDPAHPKFLAGARDARVIVGEILGHFAPDEDMHRVFTAAKRVARPDAVTVPQSYALTLALAAHERTRADAAALDDVHGISLVALRRLLTSRPLVDTVRSSELLGDEARTDTFAVAGPMPRTYRATFTASRAGAANAVVAGFDCMLDDRTRLSTAVDSAPTTWEQTVFPLDPPLDVVPGTAVTLTLEPRLVTERATYRWRAETATEVRTGDAMSGMLSEGNADWLAEIGLQLKAPTTTTWTSSLDVLSSMLAGGPTDDVATLAARALAAHPQRFADVDDARQEVLRLLRLLEIF